MKVAMLLILPALAAISALAAGQVNFLNTSLTLVSTNSPGGELGVTSGGVGSYYYGLFWAPLGQTDSAAFQFVSYGTNQTVVGRFAGGVGMAAPAIPAQSVGTTVQVLVRGWSGNLGPNWDYVKSVLAQPDRFNDYFSYGESGVGQVVLGGGVIPIPNPFGVLPGQISSPFVLAYPHVSNIIPEPSSFALAGLGAAALLIFRRRK